VLSEPISFEFIPTHLYNDYLNLCHCGTDICPAGVSHGPLEKNYYLIHCVLSGSGSFTVGNIKYHLDPGDAFLIRPNQTVLYAADQNSEWEYAFFAFNGAVARQLLDRTSFETKDVIHIKDIGVCDLIKETTKGIAGHGGSKDLYAVTQLMKILLCLAEQKDTSDNAEYHPLRSDIKSVLDYIAQHYAENVTVAKLADLIALDRSYFCRIFKKAVGMSPKQYLIEMRLDKARLMLTETTLPITRISLLVGFQSFPAFSRLFVNKYQQSPRKYREIFVSEKQDTVCLGSR